MPRTADFIVFSVKYRHALHIRWYDVRLVYGGKRLKTVSGKLTRISQLSPCVLVVLRGVYSDTTQLNSGQRPVYDVINKNTTDLLRADWLYAVQLGQFS